MTAVALPLPAVREDWRTDALCREVGDDELWYPTGGPAEVRRKVMQAKLVCGLCDVWEDCLQFTLDTNQAEGVWGGLTAEERAPDDGLRWCQAGCGGRIPTTKHYCGPCRVVVTQDNKRRSEARHR